MNFMENVVQTTSTRDLIVRHVYRSLRQPENQSNETEKQLPTILTQLSKMFSFQITVEDLPSAK